MYSLRSRGIHTFLVTVGLLSSCSEGVAPIADGTGEPTLRAIATGLTPRPLSKLENMFADLERDVPGAAGFFVDDSGRLVVQVKGAQAGNAFRDHVATKLAAMPGLSRAVASRQTSIRAAKHAFSELRQARDQVIHASTRLVMSIDLDERSNAITIGVVDPLDSVVVRKELEAGGVASNILRFEKHAAISSASNTQARIRPVLGGHIFRYYFGVLGQFNFCTMGYNAAYQYSVSGYISNSHCTHTPYGTVHSFDGYQNTTNAANAFAYEYVDPQYFTGGFCVSGWACRWADVAFFAFKGGVTHNFNRISRPSGPVGINAPGSRNVSGSLVVAGAFPTSIVGEELHKLGATTGWTRGVITATCVDEPTDLYRDGYQVRIICTDRSTIHVDLGDSGSPVFKWYNTSDSSIYMYGLIWGRDATGGAAISESFSISQDLPSTSFYF